MQLVLVGPEVVELRKRVLQVLPAAPRHGAQCRDGVAQRTVLKGGEGLHTKLEQVPASILLACPATGAMDTDGLEQVLAQLAGDRARRFATAVNQLPVLQANADRLILAANRD